MNGIGKTLLIIVSMVLAEHAMAQGVVLFANQPLGATRRIFDVDATTPVSGANFLAQLLYQDNTGAWVAHPGTAVFFDSSLVNFRGYWWGANRTLVNAGGVPSSGDPTRAFPVNMQIKVWDGGSGMAPLTFEQAVAVGMKWGMSDVFVYVEQWGAGVPGADDKFMRTFRSFSLVPEPSTLALFAMGMGWLVWRGCKRRMNDES